MRKYEGKMVLLQTTHAKTHKHGCKKECRRMRMQGTVLAVCKAPYWQYIFSVDNKYS